MERESQETHKGEKGKWKQSQVQDNDKVKCALNGSVQSERDKAQPADKVRAAEGNGRSGKALGTAPMISVSVQKQATPTHQHHLLEKEAHAADWCTT